MSSFKKVLLFVVASGLCAFASQVFAVTTIFYDDFQSDACYPPDNTGPAIGAGDIGGEWQVVEFGVDNNVEVILETEGPHAGEQWCQLRDPGGSSAAQAWAMLDSDSMLMTLNKTVTISSTIYKCGGSTRMGVSLVDIDEAVEANDNPYGQLFQVYFRDDGTIEYYDPADNDGTTYTLNGVGYTVDAWQDITLTADLAAKTFTLAVTGQGSGAGSWVGDIHKIQSVAFYAAIQSTPSTYCYMDYVQIDTSADGMPVPGDANTDGSVNSLDAQILADHWLADGELFWWDGDFNGDGEVNDADATLLAANWSTAPASASVPEPGTIVMLLAGVLSLVVLRRREF